MVLPLAGVHVYLQTRALTHLQTLMNLHASISYTRTFRTVFDKTRGPGASVSGERILAFSLPCICKHAPLEKIAYTA